MVLADGLAVVPFYQGSQLRPGHHITGPAIITQSDTTVYLAADDKLEVDRYRNLVIEVGESRYG